MGKYSNLLKNFYFKKPNKVYRKKNVKIKTACM